MDAATRLEGRAWDEAVEELLDLCAVLQSWFDEHGPAVWAIEIGRDAALMRRGDAYGLQRLVSHFAKGEFGSSIAAGEAEPALARVHLLATVILRSMDL